MKLMNFHSSQNTSTTSQQISGKGNINTLVVAIRDSPHLSNDKSPDASRILKTRISLSSGIVDRYDKNPKPSFPIIKRISEVWSNLSEFPPCLPTLKLDQTHPTRRR